VAYETPAELLGRLRLGREEFCQRLLTCLIVGGPYPKWNARSKPSPQGLAFLRVVHERCFGGRWPGDDLDFVDEFELPARHSAEPGGCPDYAVLWPNHLWIIELKTEKGSHRQDQIPGYFAFGNHHYPRSVLDVLYITPPMAAPYQPLRPGDRYAHLTWTELSEAIRATWPVGRADGEQEVIDGLLDAIDSLHLPARDWREATYGKSVSAPPAPVAQLAPPASVAVDSTETGDASTAPLDVALGLAAETAADGKQRALDFWLGSLGDLLDLKFAVRQELAASPAESPLRHVGPWMWRPESLGGPLTPAGEEFGIELRFSRHQKPQY